MRQTGIKFEVFSISTYKLGPIIFTQRSPKLEVIFKNMSLM